MEASFKISEEKRVENEKKERSKGKSCGICMEEIIAIEQSSGRYRCIFDT